MPAPTNISFLTALDLGSTLPIEYSQDVHFAGTTYEVFYSFTAPAGVTVVGAFGFGDLSVYRPTIRPYLGPAGAPTQVLSIAAQNVPIQFPVTPGSTYFLKVTSNAGNPTPATLSLSILAAPTASADVCGAALIIDDSFGHPAAVIDPDTGDVLGFVHPFPAGEAGDTLRSGVIAVEEFATPSVKLYDADFAQLAEVPINTQTAAGSIRANATLDRFFAIQKGTNPDEVKVILPDGTVSATHAITGVNNMRALAVNPAGTTLYYSKDTGDLAAIYRWDLVGGVALSDLVNLGTTTNVFDIIALEDASVLALWSNGAGTVTARRYDASGTLLNTYAFSPDATLDFPAGTLPRIAVGGNQGQFRLMTTHDGGLTRLRTVRVSDGTVLTNVTTPQFEGGIYQGTESADAPRFGVSFSCPLISLQCLDPAIDPSIPGADCCGGCGCTECCGSGKSMLTGRIGPGILPPIEESWGAADFLPVEDEGRLFEIDEIAGEFEPPEQWV